MPAQSIELQSLSTMDRVKRLFQPSEPQQPYEPIHGDTHEDGDSTLDEVYEDEPEPHFSWVEYLIFMLLGVAMLWAW